MDGARVSPYRLLGGLRHAQSLNNLSSIPSLQSNYRSIRDQNCPVHGSQGKCICRSFVADDDLKNSELLHRNGHYIEQIGDNNANNNDTVSSKIRPFTNNPALPHTQRDIVGNNLSFNSQSQAHGWNNIDNEQLGPLAVYRDALKQNLTSSARMNSSTVPKMHFGRSGGHWPHIKATNTHSAANLMFIDGTIGSDNSFKYAMPRFGCTPLSRQNSFASPSNQDLPNKTPNITAASLDSMTWSATEQLNHRPSLSQYSNRYERHAKDGFSYWPTDINYKKPRCKPGTTGTYKRWLGLSDSILKL
ncbi:unnamed protein product [Rotaria socialis]|uniref:Uncharacterized protein n=1 Tax=Rotaria socialis TaxID=392032 RepID=A0A820VC15_9BILA|nr:unnamed protein product [Rotaria socialis]CAF3635719.1 unnamed protein product [Rotaria socialis]CAF4150229.1 unnamed protein product [Rotaria socialis]CAF4497790.1 unnamed protein product [Rotaria socialis]CAF4688855.1 unnamed protein product [Rotaria socialis]